MNQTPTTFEYSSVSANGSLALAWVGVRAEERGVGDWEGTLGFGGCGGI